MFKNYIKTAWRNIRRQKGYAMINVTGLAIGVAACLLILQYVSFELSYEDFQVNGDRIYRVKQDRYDAGKLSTEWAGGAFAAGNVFKAEVPGIEDYVKVVPNDNVVVEVNNEPLQVEKVFYGSGSFFHVFTYPLVAGDKKTALSEPFTVAVSESTARKLFGSSNVIGKTLHVNRSVDYKITAVYKDAPANTQLKPNLLLSYATFVKQNTDSTGNGPENAWYWDGCLTYLLLDKNADPVGIEKKMKSVADKYTGEFMKQYNAAVTYLLQPLDDIHLNSHFIGEPEPNGDGKTVYLLLGIAMFIVLIAWVNYINLATARAIKRAKEVGIRKTIGSRRHQLVFQFLSESALLNAFALILAILLVVVSIPAFNTLSGQNLSFSLITTSGFWSGVVILFVAGTFVSGLYPAFVLSRFKPIDVLKGDMTATSQGSLLRKGLVVFQFAASLFLLIGTTAVYRQIQFMRKQSLGLNIEQTLVVKPPIVVNDSTYLRNITGLKEKLSQQSFVKGATISTSIPGEAVRWNAGGIKIVGKDVSEQKQYRVIGVDYDYLKSYGIKLLAGRAFSKEYGSDDQAVIFTKRGFDQLGGLHAKSYQ